MTERPILFSAPMVRALLAGTKTQTRRVMKPQPAPGFLARGVHSIVAQWPHQDGVRWFMNDGLSELVKCPYGKPGERLWVRESFWGCDLPGYGDQPCVVYDDEWAGKEYKPAEPRPWGRMFGRIPSIHMPRDCSRITLEITGVRVERLQAISTDDAIREGIETNAAWQGGFYRNYELQDERDVRCLTPIASFCTLWKSINGLESWVANPWVWVVEFRHLPATFPCAA